MVRELTWHGKNSRFISATCQRCEKLQFVLSIEKCFLIYIVFWHLNYEIQILNRKLYYDIEDRHIRVEYSMMPLIRKFEFWLALYLYKFVLLYGLRLLQKRIKHWTKPFNNHVTVQSKSFTVCYCIYSMHDIISLLYHTWKTKHWLKRLYSKQSMVTTM